MLFHSRRGQEQRDFVIAKTSADRTAADPLVDTIPDVVEQQQFHFSKDRRMLILKCFLVGAVSSTSPSNSGAFPLLVAQTEMTPSATSIRKNPDASSYGTPPGSSPYFNSASAARLLVNPSTSTNRGSPEARRQLARQQALQDARLVQCYEAVVDWEQCFYYGTNGQPGSAAPMTLPDFGGSASSLSPKGSITTKRLASKANVPTW
jgi:hypothetical protein